MGTKATGLGANFYLAGYDLSNDTRDLNKINGGPKPIEVTGIDKSALERLGGQRDGGMDFTVYHNPTAAHVVLSALPTADQVASYAHAPAIGNPAACCVSKQIDYNPTRANTGELTFAVSVQANGSGLEWGVQLTAGKRTDTAATSGTAWDSGGASAGFGAQAYLQVFAFTGTDVTVKLQDSADNATFADVTGGAFAQVTSAPGAQRITTAANLTVRRYVRAVTVTSGGFTSVTFAAAVMVNPVVVVF